jgi:transglutaminase-like putative cysteine protease
MRIQIVHETAYRYAEPANRAIQILRLSPRGHDGQYIHNWRIDVDRDCRLDSTTDPFGNLVHSFTADGPFEALVITAAGIVETQDTQGILTGQVERFPPAVFLRDTPLTTADAAIRDFADKIAAESTSGRLDQLHELTRAVQERMRFDVDSTDTGTGAHEAFAHGHGVCQDFAHVFIAAARHLGVPARYVGGYLFRPDLLHGQEAGHAWVEALVENIGWVGFDPTNGICPTDAYVRVAVGLDYLGTAPVRGTRYGGSGETMTVRVSVHETGKSGR